MRECGLKRPTDRDSAYEFLVTPLAGVWIETLHLISYRILKESLPLRECGLKLAVLQQISMGMRSLPLRECGLKPLFSSAYITAIKVTPLAGVWIETTCNFTRSRFHQVTPLAGVWIETIFIAVSFDDAHASLPLRECGLKLVL